MPHSRCLTRIPRRGLAGAPGRTKRLSFSGASSRRPPISAKGDNAIFPFFAITYRIYHSYTIIASPFWIKRASKALRPFRRLSLRGTSAHTGDVAIRPPEALNISEIVTWPLGERIATTSLRTGLAMTGFVWCTNTKRASALLPKPEGLCCFRIIRRGP